MRTIDLSERVEEIEFAKRAAKRFAEDPKMYSFGDITPGNFLALRWGLGDDCVLVLRLDKSFEPINYQQLVKEYQRKEKDDGET